MDYCALATARSIPIAQEIARALRRPRPAARHRRAEASTSPAASTPAATTMSAISASSASTSRARRSTRSRSAAARPATPRSASMVGPGFAAEAVPDAVEHHRRHLSRAPRTTGETLHRHLSPRRRRAVQGGALCRCLRMAAWSPTTGSTVADDAPLPDAPAILSSHACAPRTGGRATPRSASHSTRRRSRRRSPTCCRGCRWSRCCCRSRRTAAPSPRPARCASISASRARSAPPGMCCPTSTACCGAAASARCRCRTAPMPRSGRARPIWSISPTSRRAMPARPLGLRRRRLERV